jgi:hypothetical protein
VRSSVWTEVRLGIAVALVLQGAAGCVHDPLAIDRASRASIEQAGSHARVHGHVRAVERERRRERRASPPRFECMAGMRDAVRQRPGPDVLVDGARGDWVRDPADVIKWAGDRLFVLRCGRLTVVGIDRGLEVLESIVLERDRTRWRAESLLVLGDRVVVVRRKPGWHRGPGQRADLLELRTFALQPDGALVENEAIELRLGRFHTYAERIQIVGDAITVYTQLPLVAARPTLALPAVRELGGWRPLIRPAELQRPLSMSTTAHVMIRCRLGADAICTAAGIIAGGTGLVRVEDDAVYAWSHAGPRFDALPEAAIVRLTYDGAPATAVRTWGRPMHELAWRIDMDGDVDALVQVPERVAPSTGVARLHVPSGRLRAGLTTMSVTQLHPLAVVADEGYMAPVRFIGARVVYARSSERECMDETTLVVEDLADGRAREIAVPHCVDRIDVIGDTAIAIDAPRHPDLPDTRMTAFTLGPEPTIGDTVITDDAFGEWLRIYGSFASDTLGSIAMGTRAGDDEAWPHSASAVRFVSIEGASLRPRGVLRARWRFDPFEGCAEEPRVVFVGDRTFALLRNELVEGELVDDAVIERGRVELAPPPTRVLR